jgi:hypothetical protein
MANLKISQLTAAASVSGTQEFEINESGTSKKVTGSQIKTFVKDGLVISDITGVTATAAELNYTVGATSAIQTQLNAKQTLDATLTALAAYNTAGLITQTAADTFTGRTLTGTADQIVVTNGSGVAGNPTLALAFTPVEQGGGTAMLNNKVRIGWDGDDFRINVDGADGGRIIRNVATSSGQNGQMIAAGAGVLFACRAWVNFNGTGTVAIRASGNVTSITDNGTGIYTVNFTTAMIDANYSTQVSCMGISTDSSSVSSGWVYSGGTYSTSAVRVSTGHRIYTQSGGRDDSSVVCVAVFR